MHYLIGFGLLVLIVHGWMIGNGLAKTAVFLILVPVIFLVTAGYVNWNWLNGQANVYHFGLELAFAVFVSSVVARA